MADYAINFVKFYDAAGSEFGDVNFSADALTLTDGNGGSTTFELNEPITDGGAGLFDVPGGTFLGTFVQNVGGTDVSFLVFSDNVSGDRFVVADIGAADPATVSAALPDAVPTLDTSDFTVCFLPGTLIATPSGEQAVETLAIGEQVRTADGRDVPVRWIGRQTVALLFLPEPRRPVAIAAGALGGGLPARELRVTSGHALLLDGVLVQAGALVNGTTIRRLTAAELGERVTVFHVETEAHEIILAEGAPTETFVDNTTRARFDNHAEYLALFGAEQPVEERPEPRATSARQVPQAIRARIAAAAAEATPRAA